MMGQQELLTYLAEKNIDYQKQEWYQRSEIEEVDTDQLRDDDLFLVLYQSIINKSRVEDDHLLELMTRYKKANNNFTTRQNYSSPLANKKVPHALASIQPNDGFQSRSSANAVESNVRTKLFLKAV